MTETKQNKIDQMSTTNKQQSRFERSSLGSLRSEIFTSVYESTVMRLNFSCFLK